MKTLLIAGGGTLGLYTAEELLRLGSDVEVIALEELTSDNPKLTFIRERVDDAYLTGFLAGISSIIRIPRPMKNVFPCCKRARTIWCFSPPIACTRTGSIR